MLLINGADVNSKCGLFGTPLWAASRSGRTSVAEILLSRGADVDATLSGETALYMAAYTGQYDIVQLLLRNGADVNAERKQQGTALQAAKLRGYNAVVDLLKAAGAREDVRVGASVFGGGLSNSIHKSESKVLNNSK